MALENIISRIEDIKGYLKYYGMSDSIERELWQTVCLDWNYHSNNMEGIPVSFEETQRIMLKRGEIPGKNVRDSNHVIGHDEAIAEIRALVQDKKPLTEHFIRGLHKILLKEPYYNPAITLNGEPTEKFITVGDYKLLPNNVNTSDGKYLYASPEDTRMLMPELITWCNKELEKLESHPLLIAVEFHYRFIRIHPFDDGNGRMARLLSNYILMRLGYPPIIIKTETKSHYIAALKEADKGNLNHLHIFFGNGLIESLQTYLDAAKEGLVYKEADYERKILLLTKKLEPTYMKNEKTPERMIQTIQSVYAPLLQETDRRLQKLMHLFTESHWCYFEEPQPPKYGYSVMPNYWALPNIITHFINVTTDKGGSSHQYKVMNWMTSFRSKDKHVDVEVAFKIYFYDFEYEIQTYVGIPFESSMFARMAKNIFTLIAEKKGYNGEDEFGGFHYTICKREYGTIIPKEDISKWAAELGLKVVDYIEGKADLNPQKNIEKKRLPKFILPKDISV